MQWGMKVTVPRRVVKRNEVEICSILIRSLYMYNSFRDK